MLYPERRPPGAERRHTRRRQPGRAAQGLLRLPRAAPRRMGRGGRRIQRPHPANRRRRVKDKIEEQRRTNPAFVQRFDAFYDVCRQSINPNLSVEAVETMLIQHLLTERIFRRIFDNPDFTRRNVIAVEIEKVIDSMTAQAVQPRRIPQGPRPLLQAPSNCAAESTEDYTRKAAVPEHRSTSASSRATRRKKPTRTASSTPRSPSWTSWCAASKTF